MQILLSSAMTTFTMLILLFPTILCHLGSALRAGSGTLTKFTLGDHIFYCAFTNLGEGKPPILSHVRVSREPQPHRLLYNSEFDFGGPSFQTNRIKSPSYQHKMLQFHGNGQTNGGLDYYPSKSIVTQYQQASKSMPVYPVASKFGKVDLIGSTSTGRSIMPTDEDNGGNDSWEMYSSNWEPQLLPEREDPSFTPYIGARALTNMPKFFEHLRENIKALYAKGDEDSSSSSSGEDSRAGEDSNESYGTGQVFDSEKIATPTRRGYSAHHLQQPRLFHDDKPPANSMTNRDGRSLKPFSLGNQPASSSSGSSSSPNPDERTKELLRFLRYTPEYPEANNYNPSFLFTNLGLGKRSLLLSPPR